MDSSVLATRQTPQTIVWEDIPEDIERETGPTIPSIGRRFYAYSPGTILKLGTNEDESTLTMFAHDILGSVVPHIDAHVTFTSSIRLKNGIVMTRMPGTTLTELWPNLTSEQRTEVKANLVKVLVRMRARRDMGYYGRPGSQPYATPSAMGPDIKHDFCRTRAEWDASRVKSLNVKPSTVANDRITELERVQKETATGSVLVNDPVLTHGDLSHRNIFVDPKTLEITGLIDWESANVAPAYFEYVAACLGAHSTEWRTELLDILHQVLRIESERCSQQPEEGEKLFQETLAAWNAFVDVEELAQTISDDDY